MPDRLSPEQSRRLARIVQTASPEQRGRVADLALASASFDEICALVGLDPEANRGIDRY
jgi:hypothetical protein